MSPQAKACFYFGGFRLDPAEKVLFRSGLPVNLPPKTLETLLVLVGKAGHVVEKDELMAAIWPDAFVEEGNLSQHVFMLRRTLGQGSNGQPFIETVPRRGYRFAADVSVNAPGDGTRSAIDARRRLPWKPVAAAFLLLASAGAVMWKGSQHGLAVAPPSDWVRLTDFPDSVSSPALSPDGRLLAFLRGPETFTTRGQVWLKVLPDGESVQLTDDPHAKMGPAFSPDGSRIAYTVPWDTWTVPVFGGDPRRWLPNASGLTWIADRGILFSEIRTGLHMAITTATEDRAASREVYAPAERTMMAHRSHVSPDGRWMLVVEMDTAPIFWLSCRLVSFDGGSPDRQVGPPDSRCTSAAWSPDGQWMFFSADDGTGFHIWRQRFPDGAPEQLTFGPTEEEGIAMVPDGRSFVTAVGQRQDTIWVSDTGGERRVSSEGHATQPRFSPDGARLYYLKRRTTGRIGRADRDAVRNNELWLADVETGRSERLLTGFDIEAYDLSDDGRSLVFRTRDDDHATLWLAPVDRRSPPRTLISTRSNKGSGVRLAGGHVYFVEAGEGDLASIARVSVHDRNRERLVADVNGALGLSPDARWIVAAVPDRNREGSVASVAYPLDGGAPIPVCESLCLVRWGLEGKYFYLSFLGGGDARVGETFVAPLSDGRFLPDLPPSGLSSREQARDMPGWFTIKQPELVVPGPSPSLYAFTRPFVHRNLYQIPVH